MVQLDREEREVHVSTSEAEPDILYVDTTDLMSVKRLLADSNFHIESEVRNSSYDGVDGKGLVGLRGYYKRSDVRWARLFPIHYRSVSTDNCQPPYNNTET